MRLTCLVLYFNCLVAVATSSEQSFCPASIHSVGAPITQVGLVLRSRHVRKRLQGQSQISCSLRCQQQDWCISVNYEVSRPEAGACELNTYGVETLDDANPNNSEFEKKKGWIYSQLRSAEFTQSLHACKDGSFTCSNGGTCEVDCKTFRLRCHCPAGFSGDKCENNDDECKSSPCKNGGTCVDGINRYSCTCVAGFTGKNCKTDIDECAGNPCANGGTCKDGINGFTCECPVGYSGSTCEIDIDECAGNPCANGGTCKDGINGFTCECPVGYSGSTCEIGCDLAAVGVQNRSVIPDISFSAPNYWQAPSFPSDFFSPKNARLNGDRHWAAANKNAPLYLQVDLLSLYMICAVATQGGTLSEYDTKATRYKLSLSTTESSWQIYQESGADKEFHGNYDKPTVVKNALVNRPTARYIRFIPTAWDHWPGFRVEVFGIRQ